ncbi:MAG: TfoX/Sxy family protein [Burkholderiales bacterium]
MSADFVDYVKELMAPMGPVRSKRMFGGFGIYINELFCAITIDDCLYFKVDDLNQAQFTKIGSVPFTYEKGGKTQSLHYYRAPEEALDNPSEMARWATLGMAAALRKAVNPKPAPKKMPGKTAMKTRSTRSG